MTAMNINTLEKLARGAIRGEDVTEKSESMLTSRVISPAEHRSLKSLSWQIAANVKAEHSSGTMALVRPAYSWF